MRLGAPRAAATLAAALAWTAGASPPARAARPATAAVPTAAVRVEASAPHMGTLARVVVHAPTRADGEASAQAALARIGELDARLSDYRENSEVSALARAAAGQPVPVSADLFAILEASERLAGASGGAFDVTAGRLTHLWRRARRLGAWPEAARVDDARAAGGHALVALDAARRTATLARAGVEIDPGGIAKGYAADAALAVLRERGLPSALVAIGGDVAAGDPPPGQAAWTVAIPALDAGAAPHVVRLAHAAISTSGDAEQWMTRDGVRRSHVIDLRTGWPVAGRTATTVVAARGIDADALSTAINVLDAAAGEALLAGAAGPDGGSAQALWQRVDIDGRISVRHTPRWPRAAAASLPTQRGQS